MSSLMVHTERFERLQAPLRVRHRDPETSWDAAAIGSEKWTELLRNVYAVIYDRGPLTHDEIVAEYARRQHARVTPQRIRSAVSDLVKGGSHDFDRETRFPPAVRRSEQEGRSAFGRRTQKWEAIA